MWYVPFYKQLAKNHACARACVCVCVCGGGGAFYVEFVGFLKLMTHIFHVQGCIEKFRDWTYTLECIYLI